MSQLPCLPIARYTWSWRTTAIFLLKLRRQIHILPAKALPRSLENDGILLGEQCKFFNARRDAEDHRHRRHRRGGPGHSRLRRSGVDGRAVERGEGIEDIGLIAWPFLSPTMSAAS